VPIRGITLFIFGGVAHMDQEPDRPGAEFATAIAGPIASFVVAFACWLLAQAAVAVGASTVNTRQAAIAMATSRPCLRRAPW
jgi:hypothetical protein